MIMNGEICKLHITSPQNAALNELCTQHPISKLARHIVNAIYGEMQFAGNKAQSAIRFADTGEDNRAMLITVTGKQMSHQLCVHLIRYCEPPRA